MGPTDKLATALDAHAQAVAAMQSLATELARTDATQPPSTPPRTS